MNVNKNFDEPYLLDRNQIIKKNSILMRIKLKFLIPAGILLIFVWTTFKLTPQPENLEKPIIKDLTEKTSNKINLNELFHVANCLLKQAGRKIVKIRREAELELDHKERDNSVVTKADLESHTILVHTLSHKFRNLKINSEENDEENKNFNLFYYISKCDTYEKRPDDKYALTKDINVWIDPLDATQEYSENLIDYVTVMFCIVDKNIPTAGIIHKPFTDQTFSSFYESKKLEFSDKPAYPRIIVSRSHAGLVKSIINEKMNDSMVITAAGSGYKTLSLLENKADLYLHTSKIYKWDLCAPNAILNNLGGKLTQRDGADIDYSSKQAKDKSVDGIIAVLDNYDYFFKIFKN